MTEISKDYLLGVNDFELGRLEFQHGVWKEITDSFFNRLNVREGWKVLDAGSGPGFVAFDLRERVGTQGQVTALEPSELYLNHFKNYSKEQGWKNTKAVSGTAETAGLPENYYDLIFSRWVIGFVPDPELFIKSLMRALKPGGIIALQDYAFHGLFLYPRGGDYEKLSPAVEEYWKSTGGDLRIATRIPDIYKKLGLQLLEYRPNSLAGNPDSGVFEWHHVFITHHIPLMVEQNIITEETGKAILADWNSHKENPDSIFFSPLVVDMAAVKNK
jgi:ubiquinone/menaquinone biosynthesis C-methylase UbiE